MPNPFQNIWGKGEIGEGTKLAAFVDIGGKVGKNCSIQAFVSIPPGVEIGDNVFIGPGVHFANDRTPHAEGTWDMAKTVIEDHAVIGMGALIGPGIKIGKGAFIKMGAVIKHYVEAGQVVGAGEIW